MADKMIENNQVVIMGEIVSPFTFSHQVFGEGFYLVDVMVKRLSESQDIIPVMVSERLVDVSQDYQGEWICISGQFRSYNRHEEKKNRLVLSTVRMENQIISRASAGDGMRGMPLRLPWAATFSSGDGSRAGNI